MRVADADVNECSARGHSCAHICVNNPGSYTCDCNHGYTLDRDARSCIGEWAESRQQLDALSVLYVPVSARVICVIPRK